MKTAAFFLISVGCLWALIIMWLEIVYAAAYGAPLSASLNLAIFCAWMLGPLALIIVPVMVLRGVPAPWGSVSIAMGCTILSGAILYVIVPGMVSIPTSPLWWLYVALLLTMILADWAAYQLCKTRRR
ncbi:MAG: hypothetical protein ACYC6M_13450 [Terriglobales bacterium]